MEKKNLKINAQSIRTELNSYKEKPYGCLFEYIWNSFDAGATEIRLNFTMPEEGIGSVQKVILSDNGEGWDFNNDAITNNFMSSTKNPEKNKSLPKGQYGRGRYAFIWISEKLHVYSKLKKMILNHNTEINIEDNVDCNKGTIVEFVNVYDVLSDALMSEKLFHALSVEFCWFLSENEEYKIFINDKLLDFSSLIKNSVKYNKSDLPDEIQNIIGDDFFAKIVIWKEKPSEYSRFYFIENENGKELFKLNTGLNKKNDDFWHSVYIKSSLFTNEENDLLDENVSLQQKIEFSPEEKQIRQKIINFLKKELINIRKPYLKTQSDVMYNSLRENQLIPNLNDFGIYDVTSFEDLIKTIYTISPSLFTNKNNSEKKFICATFAGLLSSQDNTLVKVVLEQLQDLSNEEQQELLDILNRTKLSNVLSTLKEIDHRLEVIDSLKCLISEHEKKTLEVRHIQKILDDNFWIFGEQFRLFSSTEGALKNVLLNYAKEILKIEDPNLINNPSGEVDLFLTKTESMGETRQNNIIIELKRASIKLGQKEYEQIENYMYKIAEESLCNGDNQYWEFYLIGRDYDERIGDKIDSSKNHGEKLRGLCFNIKDGRFKIYVRKWSDILEVEWGNKMKYLKDKLQIKQKKIPQTPDEITGKILDYKNK